MSQASRNWLCFLSFYFSLFSSASILSLPSHASELICTPRLDFYQTIDGTRVFGETEYLAQNHNVGLYRGSTMKLKPWITISDQATIGVDQNGNVVQILEFVDQHGQSRRVANFLSSKIQFHSVYLSTSGLLMAIDKKGELFVFDKKVWQNPKTNFDFQRIRRSWFYSVCGLNTTALLATAGHGALVNEFMPAYFVAGVVGTIGLTMTHLTLAARKFEVANENPNGFVATSVRLNSPIKHLQYLWSDDHTQILDFELTLENREKALLSQGLGQLEKKFLVAETRANDFDVQCEHLLLARGLRDKTADKWSLDR
jgi:hypothetical protein